jgi:hypothetical protein
VLCCRTNKVFFKPRVLVHGESEDYGQTTHLAPALLDYMEHIPVHNMSLSTLLEMTNRSPEEAIVQVSDVTRVCVSGWSAGWSLTCCVVDRS